jgi:hypothetical protein
VVEVDGVSHLLRDLKADLVEVFNHPSNVVLVQLLAIEALRMRKVICISDDRSLELLQRGEEVRLRTLAQPEYLCTCVALQFEIEHGLS